MAHLMISHDGPIIGTIGRSWHWIKTEVQEEVDLNGVDPIVMRLHAPDRTEGYILLQSIIEYL